MELESADLIIKLLQEDANTKPMKTGKLSDLHDCDIFNHKWNTIANNRTRISSKPMNSLTQHINPLTTTSNRFAPLSNLKKPLVTINSDINRRQIASNKCAVPFKKKYKIVILGDSHVEGLSEIYYSLDSAYNVMSLINPNANLDAIIPPSHFKIDNLLKNNVIIVCGETRDISRTETNVGLRCFKQFEMKTNSTNVFILDAPHHHDLRKTYVLTKK